MRWTCLKSLILSLGRLCPENLTGSGYWWDFLHFKSHERQDWAALSICAIWVNPEQAIFHQSVGRCTHPSVPLTICGAVACVTKLSCPPATGWDCARNHRRRTTGRKFSGVVLRKMKILAERLKKILLWVRWQAQTAWMRWEPARCAHAGVGALCSGFILGVLGSLYGAMLPEVLGCVVRSVCVHIYFCAITCCLSYPDSVPKQVCSLANTRNNCVSKNVFLNSLVCDKIVNWIFTLHQGCKYSSHIRTAKPTARSFNYNISLKQSFSHVFLNIV